MWKILAIVGVVLALVIGIPVASFLTYQKQGVVYENQIKAQYEQNKNTLSAYSTSMLESVQVPEMAKNALKELIEASMQGRYGPDGAKNVFLSIQEAYPGQLDSALYTRLQDQIVAGRANFADNQKMLIGKVQVYQVALDTFWSGLWLHIAGFPRLNLDDYKIVVDSRTTDIFNTGVDKPLNLGAK